LTKYRPDLDGLRAIAVGSVVLFHAGLCVVQGGFVGVDVFFVISGYLITANLHGDLQRGRFSILDFYERRARRILPALFAMLLGAAVGAALFLPDDLKLFGESVVAATVSLSNVFFYSHTGYFDLDAASTPLLHTWSLAVEEQFYLVFPVVLWASARVLRGRRGGVPAVLAALWLGSFALSLWQVAHAPRQAFYLPFDRAWELLTGSLLAAGGAPAPARRWMKEVGGGLGLLLILVPVFTLPSSAAFPGLNALAPCLGAALVIWSGLETHAAPSWAARLLRSRPMVALGLISYSLYLWHWPLLVFARYYSLGEPAPWLKALVVVASILAATASWRWVERPFRTKRLLASRPALFGAAAVSGALAGLFGVTVVLAHGLPQRLSPQARQYAAGADDHNAYRDHCFSLTAPQMEAGGYCRIGASDGRKPTLMIWGDSHADALMSAFDAQARTHGIAGIDATHGSCPPILGVEVHEHEDNGCPPVNAAAMDLIERYDIPTVVIAGRWSGYAEGRLYFTPIPPVVLRRAGAPLPDPKTWRGNHALFAEGLEATFAKLRSEGRRVFVVMPVPEVARPVSETLARAAILHRAVDFAPTRAAYDVRQRFARATLDRLARKYGVTEIDPAARLCDGPRCRLTLDGHPLYYDADHLSVHGASFVAPLVAPVFAGSPAARPEIARASAPAPATGGGEALAVSR
jgi:peptidoglycan/LPS O-acetylase OafA/YrhL